MRAVRDPMPDPPRRLRKCTADYCIASGEVQHTVIHVRAGTDSRRVSRRLWHASVHVRLRRDLGAKIRELFLRDGSTAGKAMLTKVHVL